LRRVQVYQGAAAGDKEYFRDLTAIRGPRCEHFTKGAGIQGDGVHLTRFPIWFDPLTVLKMTPEAQEYHQVVAGTYRG
jgi:hypothetical protein